MSEENVTEEPQAQGSTVGMVIDALIEEVKYLRQEHDAMIQLLLAMTGADEEQ